MQRFGPLSQYVCAECGAVLKETDADFEIATITEDCPNCGASLASSLKRRAKLDTQISQSLPKLQTAYDLARFRLDIEKISKVLPLSTTGSLCIVGDSANLLLTRLCVRTLLPANHGGLDSPNVAIVDAGNKSDYYQTVKFVRQYGLELQSTLDRIIVSRTFTIHQLESLLQRELPKVVQKYQARVVIVPGLLDLFDDPNIKKKEAKRVIERIMKSLDAISGKLLVIASLQQGNYADMVLPNFDKRITLTNADRGRLAVDVYNKKSNKTVTMTERELKIVSKQ
jgi:DNA-directed RNA polymerase subunit RPC12/RpoP